MTDKEKLDAIKEEIHRLVNVRGYDRRMANDLFTFIDSLPNEPISNDLEEAASRYAKEEYSRKNPATLPDRCIGCYAPIMYAFKAGSNWREEQLMAKAVDATVHIDAGGYPYIPQMELYDYDKDIPLAKEGDKYKVVLIKED